MLKLQAQRILSNWLSLAVSPVGGPVPSLGVHMGSNRKMHNFRAITTM